MKELKNLPGVDKLLCLSEIKLLIEKYGKELVTYSIRKTLEKYRDEIIKGSKAPGISEIISAVRWLANEDGLMPPIHYRFQNLVSEKMDADIVAMEAITYKKESVA